MLHTTIQLTMEVLEKLNDSHNTEGDDSSNSYASVESMLSDYWCLLSHDNCPAYFLSALAKNMRTFKTRIALSLKVLKSNAAAGQIRPQTSGLDL